jgi:putative transposase
MCRGNNKQLIFRSAEDKLKYYSLLFELKDENGIDILHYCLMDNHLHLIVWIREESKLARFMLQVNLAYFHYFKRTYGYDGHFWQNRYRSNLIEKDSYLLQRGKYIELNPVRAQMVAIPDEYRFSSYPHYANGKKDNIIAKSPAYLALSED